MESENKQRQYWDIYIPISRNMKRSRAGLHQKLCWGTEEIRKMWTSLPQTRHDITNADLWCYDSWPIETDLEIGMPGIVACVHGEFEEAGDHERQVIKRSFDRTFVLALDPTGGIKVSNDMLIIRSYSGPRAWQQASQAAVPQDPQPLQIQVTPLPQISQTPPTPQAAQPLVGGAVQQPDLNEEQRAKCQLFSEKSGLTIHYSEMCLRETNWELNDAWSAFQNAQVTSLP